MKKITIAILLTSIISGGCASAYKLPVEGEPFALMKSKITFDMNKARAAVPFNGEGAYVSMALFITENNKNYTVETRQVGLSEQGAKELTDITAFKIHPDRAASFSIATTVHWKTTTMEKVRETERIPKMVTKTVPEYDSRTRTTKYVTKTEREYEIKEKMVDKPVTRTHYSGCTASVNFTPGKDDVYLLDYSNLKISEGCTMDTYRQIPLKDGKFKLEPVGNESRIK